jgi:RHS repeat-associated protein
MTDDSGALVWSADYKPFGEVTITTETITNHFRFPGQYFDQETGLHYNWHREYGPAIGRYSIPDPIGLWGGINLYLYVKNNPVRFVDRNGLFEYYGYWCGPNWTGRFEKSWNELTPEEKQQAIVDPLRRPRTEMDWCCFHHDVCCGNTGQECKGDPCCEKNKLNECDENLRQCLLGLGMRDEIGDELKRVGAISVFYVQPAVRSAIEENKRSGTSWIIKVEF